MNLASLFNLEAPDLFVILVIVLLLFGARKLHELGESRDEFDRTPRPATLFNLFASVLLFVALTLFLLALAGRSSH